MHTEVEFAVEPKDITGKGAARKLRAKGKTPGVVYGPDFAPVMVTFREQDLAKALSTPAARNVFLRLKSDEQNVNGARVIVKDLQVDPVRRVFLHADFYKLDPTRVIQATVPIHLEGTSAGVKAGGIMQVARRELVVSCLPDRLPEAIVVDVTDLQVGQSIHVGDLPAPEDVRILTNLKLAVCAVIAPSGLEEEGAEEAEEAEPAEEE
jgi:large subunit ribosomal protein L25